MANPTKVSSNGTAINKSKLSSSSDVGAGCSIGGVDGGVGSGVGVGEWVGAVPAAGAPDDAQHPVQLQSNSSSKSVHVIPKIPKFP